MNIPDNENKTDNSVANEDDYTVSELLDQLINDESWETDEKYRKLAVQMLIKKMPGC